MRRQHVAGIFPQAEAVVNEHSHIKALPNKARIISTGKPSPSTGSPSFPIAEKRWCMCHRNDASVTPATQPSSVPGLPPHPLSTTEKPLVRLPNTRVDQRPVTTGIYRMSWGKDPSGCIHVNHERLHVLPTSKLCGSEFQ